MSLSDRFFWIEWTGFSEEPRSGSVREFLLQVVARQRKRRLPPHRALQDLLRRGQIGGGMTPGLLWESTLLDVDEDTYEALAKEVSPNQIVERCQASTVEEWMAWCYKQDFGIDYERHLELLNRLRAAEVACELSGHSADSERAYLAAVSQHADFLNDARRRP